MIKKSTIPHTIFAYISPFAPKLFKKREAEEKAHIEYVQDVARKNESDIEKVNDLVKKSNRCIISITAFSFIPFHLYTNTIQVEESRVTFLFKQPFTFQSHSVDIKDISNVFIESAFIFATLQVVSRTYILNDIKIGQLNKTKADKVRRVIEGLRTLANANIDTSKYEISELVEKLEELQAT